jgi:hypothetical protein
MFVRKPSFIQISTLFTGVLVLLIALTMPATVYADDPTPPPDNGNCIKCHEDLYFLHDTGKWFCLKESPMTCVGCHDGDPNATTKELAHIKRAPHPIISDDVSKCMECHPDKCIERVALFDQKAGISNILVAVPHAPAYSSEIVEAIPVTAQKAEKPVPWLGLMEILSILLIISIALVIYFYYRTRHAPKGKP